MEKRRNAETWAMLMREAKKAGMTPADVREFLYNRDPSRRDLPGAVEKECS